MSRAVSRCLHGCRFLPALSAALFALALFGCNRAKPTARTASPASAPTAQIASPATRPAQTQPAQTRPTDKYTSIVKAESAFLRRGSSDADVIYDTIAAGTRVRQVGMTADFARVVAADGREGLIDARRVESLVSEPAPVAPLMDVNGAAPGQLPEEPVATLPPGALGKRNSACPSPEAIDAVIEKAKKYLLSAQNAQGTWDAPAPAGAPVAMDRTALVLLAISESGPSLSTPELAKAVAFLRDNAPADTFIAATRAAIYAPDDRRGRKAVGDDDLVKAALARQGHDQGLFGAMLNDVAADSVSTYYGLAGVRDDEQRGAAVPMHFWANADHQIRLAQLPDGSWPLALSGQGGPAPDFRSTAAGLLALSITNQNLNARTRVVVRGDAGDASEEKALSWLDHDLKIRLPTFPGLKNPCEAACWVERVGDGLGRKYLGGKDWFSQIARWLVQTQQADGSWAGDVRATAYAMLFLTRGNATIFVNKLSYPPGAHHAAWNERQDDVANLCHWLGRELCGIPNNWQIVGIDSPVSDFLEARILYITGNHAFDFNATQIATLRDYVNRGGLILANADGGSKEFADAFQVMGHKLFPKYKFRTLPADHLIFNRWFPAKRWHSPPNVLGLSNGVRELMLLVPEADLSRAFEGRQTRIALQDYQLAANIFLYVSGKQLYRPKAQVR